MIEEEEDEENDDERKQGIYKLEKNFSKNMLTNAVGKGPQKRVIRVVSEDSVLQIAGGCLGYLAYYCGD